MKRKLCNILSRLGVTTVVTTESKTSLSFLPETIDVKEVKDARSATFEAFGIIKMSEKPVALIVKEDELSSVLTAVTEAWLQRKDLILITINGNLYQHYDYLDRCLMSSALLLQNSNEDELVQEMQLRHGPHLLRTALLLEEENPVDYSNIIQELDNGLSDNDVVFCYNPTQVSGTHNRAISLQHRYCVISKYVGYLLGCKGKAVLCIPENLLAYDSNIFNFRNLPSTFFVVVVADGSRILSKLSPWIESNGISVIQTESANYSTLLCEDKPKLVYIK